MKFGIVVKKGHRKGEELISKVRPYLNSKGHEVLDEKDFKDADYILTFGGDGTLIHAACNYIELGIPLVGINTGNLGFLTAQDADRWQDAIKNLVSGKVFLSERITIEAQVQPETRNSSSLSLRAEGQKPETIYRTINEAAVKSYFRMSELEILIDDGSFLRVLGDGVIIATQTGSTAYSLSSGGPIVDSALDSLLVTPINPIGLPIPSVVLSPQKKIKIKVIKGDDVSLIIDGQEHTKLKQGDEVVLRQGKYKVKFGYFDKSHLFRALNAKFGLEGRTAA